MYWYLSLSLALSLSLYIYIYIGAVGPKRLGDAGHEVYTQVLTRTTDRVLAAPLQPVEAVEEICVLGCPNNSNIEVFLSPERWGCDKLSYELPAPVKRTKTAELDRTRPGPGLNATTWRFLVDVSGLEPGSHALVCEDVDGFSGPLPPGLAIGDHVYVAGSTVTSQGTLMKGTHQHVGLECTVGCSTRSVGFLATDCDNPVEGRRSPVIIIISSSSSSSIIVVVY